MKYQLFSTLHREAAEYDSLEMYIAERGWQEWMNHYKNAEISVILKRIYSLATHDFETNRKNNTSSRVEFSNKYNIPLRTLENWANESRKMPDYVKELIDYSMFMDDYHA